MIPAGTSPVHDGGHFNELHRAESLITETLKMEETRFKENLGRGLKILVDEVEGMGEGGTLDGATAFKLYDTYGFPLDLTQDVMRGFNWKVDTDGFNSAMEEQKAKARKAWAGSGDSAMAPIYLSLANRLGSTEFLGYETTEAEALITAMIIDEAEVEAAKPGQAVSIICNQTPFTPKVVARSVIMGSFMKLAAQHRWPAPDTWKTPTGMIVHN